MARPLTSLALAATLITLPACAQTMQAPDITHDETLYAVSYAHLDTQWRWDFQQTIAEYLLKTMRVNFYLMDKYPHYVFNWSGSNRYRLMKEYYPADYARLKTFVAKGNWYPAGSSVEEGDVNLPSAEAILRQVLYGNTFFRAEFGKASSEYMLPDCFGFPASLPTILHHAGVLGFSTQKLNSAWQPAPLVGGPNSPEKTPEGIPYNVGVWQGPDGSTILAALNPGNYEGTVTTDLSSPPPPGAPAPRGFRQEQDWGARIALDGKLTGVFADYHYVGTGDIGGATTEDSVRLLEDTVTHKNGWGNGPVHVVEAAADQMFKDIKPDMQSKMPRYSGDLELINHSAGSLTSQAMHKRWNRKNELLADAAEKASVGAAWLGGPSYPHQQLTDAWTLLLGGQFHDTAAGTALPRGYEFAQNDDLIAANQFASVLTSATQSIASALDTTGEGIPIVVYNPLNIPREDIVEATLPNPSGAPSQSASSIEVGSATITDAAGSTVPSQIVNGKIVFIAKTPSVGYAVYHVEPGARAAASQSLKATFNSLENARYLVKLNSEGDVSSIFDKSLNKELLSAPIRLAISTDTPKQWPAWNMDFDQEQAAPRAYVAPSAQAPAKIRISENGPACVALEITRDTEGSHFVQTVRLAAGEAGNRVEFTAAIDWHGLASNLKAVFPLTASSPNATYNEEIGTVQRPNAFDRQFEVGAHHWIDLTDTSNTFGTTILTDVKNASDKRDDHTLRLTLLRTPGYRPDAKNHPYSDQANQDWGHHEITFGLTGHAGDWREGYGSEPYWQAYRLSSPLIAFATTPHPGPRGKEFSIVEVSNPRVRVLALKKSEISDELILRLVELDGKAAPSVVVRFPATITAAREVNAQELPLANAEQPNLKEGMLTTAFTPYQPRTFALKLAPATTPSGKAGALTSQPITIPYTLATASNDDTPTAAGMDSAHNALPAEMLPRTLAYSGITFQLATAATGQPNALVPTGQTLQIPAHTNTVWILAAAAGADEQATFQVGSQPVPLTVQSWSGFIGQADTRIWSPPPANIRTDWSVSANHQPWELKKPGTDDWHESSPDWSPKYPEDYLGLRPGYVKPAALAWYASHHHTAAGLNVPYEYSYLFAYPIAVPSNAHTLTLPANANLRILAITAATEPPPVTAAQPLFDTLNHATPGPMIPAVK